MTGDAGQIENRALRREPTLALEQDRPYGLSLRELEVLQFLAEGQHNREIAWELSISQATVNKHVSSVIGKLRAKSRTHAAAKAVREGLVS